MTTTSERPEWTPFKELDAGYWAALYRDRYGDEAEKLDSAGVPMIPERVFQNSRYTVFYNKVPPIAEGFPDMITLSIRQHEREIMRDWRDLQRIKNEIVGPDHEAVELFPAEDRLVDTANQYHLWVLASAEVRFPFGFRRRAVVDGTSELTEAGTRQRKMENPPPDAMSEKEITDIHAAAIKRGKRHRRA